MYVSMCTVTHIHTYTRKSDEEENEDKDIAITTAAAESVLMSLVYLPQLPFTDQPT